MHVHCPVYIIINDGDLDTNKISKNISTYNTDRVS